jgi:hypothetical protein
MSEELQCKVGLSAKELANLPRNIYEKDFTFYILFLVPTLSQGIPYFISYRPFEYPGPKKSIPFIVGKERYGCLSFIAPFLAPWIAQLQASDLTLRDFILTTEDPSHYFGDLICLGEGSTVVFLLVDML